MALKGVKVLEFAGLAPAPFCGMILADFGADVIRIDRIHSNTVLDCLGNGKKSIAVNLKDLRGVQIIKQLSKRSDVVLEPFRKGVMEKLGLGPEDLTKENPGLIYARLTGLGQTGYFSDRAGHDLNFLGLSGLLSLFGRKGEPPIFPSNLAADFGGGGLMCALGILLALYERGASGRGQTIDANMVEGTAYLGSWLYRSQGPPIWGKARGENLLDSGAHFYEVYETKDGKYMTVAAIEPQFYQLFMEGVGMDLEQIGEWETKKLLVRERFKEKTQTEWCEIFDGVDACVTPLLELTEAPRHKHNKQSFVNGVPKPAPRLSRSPGITRSTAELPDCGEHTKIILESLKYTRQDMRELEEAGVIGMKRSSKL